MAASFADLTDLARANPPVLALVLGSGMGPVAARATSAVSVPFADIPGLPAATVSGHRGCLTLGEWLGRRVLILEGRLHYYEGHSWETVVVPVRTAAALGAPAILLTNAAGGIRADLDPGSLMALSDHIEWTHPLSWRQPGPGGLGPSRPSPYSTRLLNLLGDAAMAQGWSLPRGIYAQLTGPCYETPAEIRALRAWGADAVGMSTAREAQAAVAAGMACAALSLITNRAAGLGSAPLDHREVLITANQARDRLIGLIEAFLKTV